MVFWIQRRFLRIQRHFFRLRFKYNPAPIFTNPAPLFPTQVQVQSSADFYKSSAISKNHSSRAARKRVCSFVCLHIDSCLLECGAGYPAPLLPNSTICTVRGYPLLSDLGLAEPMAELGLGQLTTSGPITCLDFGEMELKDSS